jgi:hypothetical protein
MDPDLMEPIEPSQPIESSQPSQPSGGTNGTNGTNTGIGGNGGDYDSSGNNSHSNGIGGQRGINGSNASPSGINCKSGGGGGGAGAKGGIGNAYGGDGGSGIDNTGTIINLYNSQGGNKFLLYIKGKLPINYYMIINDISGNYGQLYGDITGQTTLFNIDFSSSNINLSGTAGATKIYAKVIKKTFVSTTTIAGNASYDAILQNNTSDSNYYDLKLTKK